MKHTLIRLSICLLLCAGIIFSTSCSLLFVSHSPSPVTLIGKETLEESPTAPQEEATEQNPAASQEETSEQDPATSPEETVDQTPVTSPEETVAQSAVTSPEETEAESPITSPEETEAVTEELPPQPPEFKLPDFSVLDANGNTVKLSQLAGKPIVLNFWATWCPPCKAEMPDLQKAYEAYGEEICFVMINLTDGYYDTVDSAKQFLADNGYTFPVYFDTQNSAATAYQVSAIPTTYFISAEGEIVSQKVGMLTDAEINAAMKLLTE